ncbi:MAG: MotA/TolQ/ExbB proton channel family protein [Bacteroidetes bacterium]|nr:MotA/TolQ/ExbB proton channel family protein [Bacteroidota bacterium]
MSNQKKGSSMNNGIIFIVVAAVAVCIYLFVFGNSVNFDAAGHPLPGNYMGMVYKGGFVVPILLTLFISMWVFSIERFLAIRKANGGGNTDGFLLSVKASLVTENTSEAIAKCDKQQGSIANIMKSGLDKDAAMKSNSSLSKENKMSEIEKEMEETTALEIPMLQKNLVIISTIATVATLAGLIGTVLGMIRSFAALASAGAPDQTALANGISEALINTALGISTSFFAIVFYNYFSSAIDEITYRIDEAKFMINQNFAAKN